MIKILLLTIIILFLSCQHNQEFRMEGDLKNQSEINFIKNNCQKYNSHNKLPICVKQSKASFHCLSAVDQYLEMINLQGKIECRKEANRQFPYTTQYQQEESEDFELKEEDFEIIQENIDYFLASDKIYIYHYNKNRKKEETSAKIDDTYKNRFDTYYSRNQFIEKCQQNFDDREDIFKNRYIKECNSMLDLSKFE